MTQEEIKLHKIIDEIDRLYALPVSRKTIGKIIDLKKQKDKLWNKITGMITIDHYFEK
jgi:hypothetical protein